MTVATTIVTTALMIGANLVQRLDKPHQIECPSNLGPSQHSLPFLPFLPFYLLQQ